MIAPRTRVPLAALVLLTAGAAAEDYRPKALPDPASAVSLNSTVIDVGAPLPELPPELALPADSHLDGYYLVKFPAPTGALERQDLEGLTDRVYAYLPYYSYLVRMPKALATDAAVAAIGAVWIGDYQPGYKLSPALAELTADGSAERRIVMLHVYPDADLAAVAAEIGALVTGGVVGARQGTFFSRVRVLMTADEIAAKRDDLARIRDVFWVDLEARKVLHNDTSIWVGQSGTAGGGATPVFDHGIFGAGQVIAVLDTGLDPDMCYFRDASGELPAENDCDGGTAINPDHRKVLAIDYLWQDDCDGTTLNKNDNQSHGTHVAGTALGDDDATPVFHDPGDGMAPAARLIVQDGGFATDDCADLPALGCPVVDLKPFFQQAYDQGARLHTNSWGDDENNPVQRLYTAGTQDADEFTWNHKDFLLLAAAGNSAATGVGSPATGKNVVGVGATQRGASAESMASFSSHGPTDDGRIKPDVTTPGQSIVSAAADVNVNLPDNCGTSSKSGTSMASPGAAGLAALVREYFTAGWYPSASPDPADGFTPSAALLKAALVSSAAAMTGATPIPSNTQGWGRVLLDNVLELPGDARKLWLTDDATGFALGSTGEEKSHRFSVSAGEPFKVTLAWTDFPSTPAANPHLNNDLDLRVTGPDGTFLGNVFAGGVSATGGSPNRLDTVEQVLLSAPTDGLYTVTVSSFNVPDGPQPFALVVTGAIVEEEECRALPASAALAGAGLAIRSGDGDEFLDNCENADQSLTVTNDGGADLHNVEIVAVSSPSHPGVVVHDDLPIPVAAEIVAGCDGPRGTATAGFNFTARGLGHGETLVFEVQVDADELAMPVSAVVTISGVETDLELRPEIRFDFEAGDDGWRVVQGTFDRTDVPPPGAEGTSFYFASSAAADNQCDQVRSPALRLTSTSTLTLWNQFGIEPGTAATGFYDRANVALVDVATGARTTVEPDGGLRPYDVPAGTPNGSCVTVNQAGWSGAGPGWLDATWSAAALGVDALPAAGHELFVDVAYGTDSLISGTGFWFDQVTVTDVLAKAEDGASDVCVALPPGRGRVHGAGFLDGPASGGDLDKIDFRFDARIRDGVLEGKLKLHDKAIGVKIDASAITALAAGGGECNGVATSAENGFEFTAAGTFNGIPGAELRVCGEDNGNPGKGGETHPPDRFFLECVSGCTYTTAARSPDDGIDGGNVHLHEAIALAGPGAKSAGSQLEVIDLDPILLGKAAAGAPLVLTAVASAPDGVPLIGRELTLRWRTASGSVGGTTSVTDGFGAAIFIVTVQVGDVRYWVEADGLESNGIALTGLFEDSGRGAILLFGDRHRTSSPSRPGHSRASGSRPMAGPGAADPRSGCAGADRGATGSTSRRARRSTGARGRRGSRRAGRRALRQAGLPARIGAFDGYPAELQWDEGQRFRPEELEGHRQTALVGVMTDGALLVKHAREGRQDEVEALLRSLATWERLAFVDFSDGTELATLLRSCGVPCVAPEDLPYFFGIGSGHAPEARETDPGELRTWGVTLALAPRTAGRDDAYALRHELGLGISPLKLRRLEAESIVGGQLVWEKRRAGEIRWLRNSGDTGALDQALGYWERRLAEENPAARQNPWTALPKARAPLEPSTRRAMCGSGFSTATTRTCIGSA